MRTKTAIVIALFSAAALLACEDVRFTDNPLQIDTFQQTPLPTVDILWVVDNSGTMREERVELGNKFDQFMSQLEEVGADYHIGVVSTDTTDPTHSGRLQGDPRVITPETQDAKQVFIANVDLPETADRTERGLDAMRMALSDELLSGYNNDFLRSEATLLVIVVSDEDDHSIGPTRYYSRWLEHLKGKGEENLVSFSAIVGQRPTGCQGAEKGERYLQVEEVTGGLFYSICEQDYGPVVQALGISAAGMRRKFYLSEQPKLDTMRVMVFAPDTAGCTKSDDCAQGDVCTADGHCADDLDNISDGGVWTYEGGDNAVFFSESYLPPAGSNIYVAYFRGTQ
ncbi:MAG TPA: vWA domain-containing protein [Myxococcota bacterium]|nr:vWA domain-containing protein [Myxococcota bacterium]